MRNNVLAMPSARSGGLRLEPVPVSPLRAPATIAGLIQPYRAGEMNRCSGCTRSHWLIGRLSAECAFCGMPAPIMTGER